MADPEERFSRLTTNLDVGGAIWGFVGIYPVQLYKSQRQEKSQRVHSQIKKHYVVGATISLNSRLDII